jgi:SHS family lactate transporter-like MFS transporter
MSAHDRRFGIRHAFQLLFRQWVLLNHALAAHLFLFLSFDVFGSVIVVAMDVLESLQAQFHVLRQGVVSGSGTRKAGVAQRDVVFDRHLQRIECGEQTRFPLVREIAVPETAGIFDADRLPVFVEDVGHNQDFRIAVQPVLFAHVVLEHPEAARERDLLFWGDLLVAEDHHTVLEKRFRDSCESSVVQRAGEVDSGYLGAEVFAEAAYGNHVDSCDNSCYGKTTMKQFQTADSEKSEFTHPNPNSRADNRNAVVASILGWTLDSFDYFVVVMALTEIAKEFHRTNAEVALTITITLAFRPVGAFLFGLMADKYGRRKTLIIDVIAFSFLSIASGLAPNFTTFLIVRALFGVAMGGEWGASASLVMEKISPKWRGLVSGVLQQGYTTGGLLASIAYFLIVPYFGWRALFFAGGAPALLALFIRTKVKESEVWERTHGKELGQLWDTIRSNLPVFLYLIVFLTFMSFCGHGTDDMYPTFLKTQRGFSPRSAAVITMVANIGALLGGVLVAMMSDRVGRRRSIASGLGLAALVIPLWVFSPNIPMLALGAFFIQFGVHGAWGVVPAHILELVPDQIRGFMPGFAYQCGILLAGSITYLQALFGGATSYSNAMAFSALAVFAATALVVSLGPEKKGVVFGT